jgi:oligopeptide/dipeptide ABC transporter ATP-binding protein
MEASAPLLTLDALTTRFKIRGGFGRPSGMVHAAENVSFQVGRREIVGLVGESGSGKSTVGRTILRLERASAGSVLFDGDEVLTLQGRALAGFRRRVAAVFQDPATSLDPRMRVGEIVTEPLLAHRLAGRAERRDRAAALLTQVGLSADDARRHPHAFSGGQRQRVAIARALAVGPDLIVADEPVSALDVSVQAQVINLLLRLRDELGLALLFISHDLPTVEFLCDSVVVMYLGRVMERAPAAQFQQAPLHPYSQMLVRSAPRFGERLEVGPSADGGETPSPLAPPSGCVFRTRCPRATSECALAVPPLQQVEPGRWLACIHQGAIV